MTEQTTNPAKVDVDTGVNPFNGTSDPEREAAVAQKLWDAGAFNADGEPDAEQGQADAEPAEAPATEEAPAWHQDYLAMEKAEQWAETNRAHTSQQLQQALQQGQQAQAQLEAAARAVPWDRLRAENPQQYHALLNEYQTKQAQNWQQMQQLQGHAQQLAGEYISAEREKVLRAMPEWRDPAAFEAAKQDMLAYARQHGITEAELAGLTDSRHLIALFHASQVRKPPAPKVPGVRLNKANAAPRPAKAPKAPPAGLDGARERFLNDPRDVRAQSAYAQRLLDAGA